MDDARSQPLILLLHDGELRDVRALLDSLGIPIHERVGRLRPAEAKASWQAVIGSPRRLLEYKPPDKGRRPTLVAIADQASKTLKSQMQRLRIDYVANRPVHPVALRLLVLHVVYRGPERRKRDRVSIGADVRVRTGLFAKPATLAEISQRGARIVTQQPIAKGTKVKLAIGRELTKAGMLRLAATVVRTAPADGGATEAGLRFDDLGARAFEHLRRFVDLHKRGPVQVRHQIAGVSRVMNTISESSAASRASAARRATPVAPPTVATAPPAASATEIDDADRRGASRRSYDSRVVALVDEAARVLLGRDISTGGMRVDPHEELGLGFRVKLAVHSGPRSEPVLVDAIVDRDDGQGGVFLRFVDLSEPVAREIDEVMRRLELSSDDEGEESSLVVSELVSVESQPS